MTGAVWQLFAIMVQAGAFAAQVAIAIRMRRDSRKMARVMHELGWRVA